MKKINKQILNVSGIAFKNIAMVLLLVLIGIKIDEYFSLKPIFTIICSILSLVYVISYMLLAGKSKNEL